MSTEHRNILTEAQCAERGFGPAHPEHPRYAEIYDVVTGEPLDPQGLMESLKRTALPADATEAVMNEMVEI